MEGKREFEGQESFLGESRGTKKFTSVLPVCLAVSLYSHFRQIADPLLFCIGCYIASIQVELVCVCKIYLCVCVRKSQSRFSLWTKKVCRSMSEGECSLGSVLSRTSEPSRMSLGQKMNSSSWAARSQPRRQQAVMDSPARREMARNGEGPMDGRRTPMREGVGRVLTYFAFFPCVAGDSFAAAAALSFT